MNDSIKILVFKTNLESDEEVKTIQPILDEHPEILRWNVDRWDVDKILRIETSEESSPAGFMEMIRKEGFRCEELTD